MSHNIHQNKGDRMNELVGKLIFLAWIVLSSAQFFSQRTSILSVEDFRVCSEYRKLPNGFLNTTIRRVTRDKFVLSGDYLAGVTERNLKAKVTLHRCQDRKGMNCEVFLTFVKTNYCNLLLEKSRFWTNLYDAFNPKPACTSPKGIYRLTDGTFIPEKAAEMMKFIPDFLEYYWKLQLLLLNDTMKFSCTEVMFKMDKIRRST